MATINKLAVLINRLKNTCGFCIAGYKRVPIK
jgi:hypothetical protein